MKGKNRRKFEGRDYYSKAKERGLVYNKTLLNSELYELVKDSIDDEDINLDKINT